MERMSWTPRKKAEINIVSLTPSVPHWVLDRISLNVMCIYHVASYFNEHSHMLHTNSACWIIGAHKQSSRQDKLRWQGKMKGMLFKKGVVFYVPSLQHSGPLYSGPAVMSVICLKGEHTAHHALSNVDTLFIIWAFLFNATLQPLKTADRAIMTLI